jgi:hypothetical protein
LLERNIGANLVFESFQSELCTEYRTEGPSESYSAGDAEFAVAEVLQPKPGGEADKHNHETTVAIVVNRQQERRRCANSANAIHNENDAPWREAS